MKKSSPDRLYQKQRKDGKRASGRHGERRSPSSPRGDIGKSTRRDDGRDGGREHKEHRERSSRKLSSSSAESRKSSKSRNRSVHGKNGRDGYDSKKHHQRSHRRSRSRDRDQHHNRRDKDKSRERHRKRERSPPGRNKKYGDDERYETRRRDDYPSTSKKSSKALALEKLNQPKSEAQLKKEEEEKAEEQRKKQMQRLLRARIAASQMNTDLEMEEAQNEYTKQEEQRQELQQQNKQDPKFSKFIDEDDIQMPEVQSIQPSCDNGNAAPIKSFQEIDPQQKQETLLPIAQSSNSIITNTQPKMASISLSFKKPEPKLSINSNSKPGGFSKFSTLFNRKSDILKPTQRTSIFSNFKQPLPRKPVSIDRSLSNAPVEADEIDPLDAFMLDITNEAVQQETFDSAQLKANQSQNAITLEDIQNQIIEDPQEVEAQTSADNDNQFLSKLKTKAAKDCLQTSMAGQSNELLINDDEDKFMHRLEMMGNNDTSTAGYIGQQDRAQDRERKREAKKDLQFYDEVHDTLNEMVINKDLYIESQEITKMTDQEVAVYRKKYGEIKVRGFNCPKPIQNWYQCGLPAPIIELIEKKKFEKPFPIQSQALPVGMSGRDLIGIAETGSGKTLAYVLPMIRHIRDQRPVREGIDGPIGLVIAPTRELVLQIYKETKSFAKACGVRVVAIYGGVSVQDQLPQLKRGTEIAVCTPGRMRDVLALSNGKITNLKRVSYVVLDEADRILDMGFEPQIKVMLENCRPDKQTVMFSATFPRSIENLAKSILTQPVEIVVGNRGQTCQNIEQMVELHEDEDKFLRLMELLGEWQEKGSILIFVDKQVEADDLFKELYKVGYKAIVLHGGQDQIDREGFIQDFKDNVRNIMVATSVCARGLDISHIKLVVNYVCPNHIEDYVHRVGRTGRAGNQGTAITFITHDECQYASDLIMALENSNKDVPEFLRDLHEEYIQKVQDGDIERKRANIGFIGKGFKFDASEEDRVREMRLELSKGYGLAVDDKEDDIDFDKDEQDKFEEREKQDHHKLLKLLDKDEQARKVALEAGENASRQALRQGNYAAEQVAEIAKQEMLNALKDFVPTNVTAERGVDTALKIRDMFVECENQREGIFTYDIEINDLQPMIRCKVQSKDFISQIQEISSCKVLSKGSFIEAGKKAAIGTRKQYLYIEGASKQNVANAYNEIKRLIDELQMAQNQMANQSYLQGFSGQFGKF